MTINSKLKAIKSDWSSLNPLAQKVMFFTAVVTAILGNIKNMETLILVRRVFVVTSFSIALVFVLQYLLHLYFKTIESEK
jgi:hypothetical protein